MPLGARWHLGTDSTLRGAPPARASMPHPRRGPNPITIAGAVAPAPAAWAATCRVLIPLTTSQPSACTTTPEDNVGEDSTIMLHGPRGHPDD